MCPEESHQEEPLCLYCQKCLECVCQVCYEESHRRHVVVHVEDAAEPKKQQINETLVQIEQEIAALNDKIKEGQESFETREKEINAARRIVTAYVKAAIHSLEKHKEAMLTELDDIDAELQQRHAATQGKLELLVQQFKSPVEYGKCILKRNYDVEILKERQAVINRYVCLLNSRQDWDSFQFPCVKYTVDKKASFENVRDLRPGRVIVRNGNPSNVHVSVPHVYKRAFQLGSDGYLDESYSSPCGVAVCKTSGNIAVADRGRRRISLFSPDGKYLRHFGDLREGSKNLSSPYSVAFSWLGEIIVVDSVNLMFCSDRGLFLRYVGNVALPKSVSVSEDGQLIVCDKNDAKVKVLCPYTSGILKSFPTDPDLEKCQPSFAILHGDKFFVSYPKRHCVKAFSYDGDFLYDIGTKGCEQEQLGKPQGLAIDRFNNLVVCDSDKSRLQVYKPDGRHVATVEAESSKLVSPQFVAVSKDGHLFVTDSGRKGGQPFNLAAKESSCIHIFY